MQTLYGLPTYLLSMDNTSVIGSGKLPSEGVNAPGKKKLSLSWWRQQKKTSTAASIQP
jgi:hypothetical protein